MDFKLILGLILLFFSMASAFVFIYYYFFVNRSSDLRSLMGQSSELGNSRERYEKLRNDPDDETLKKIKIATKKSSSKKQEVSFEEKLFRAGMYTEREKTEFARLRVFINKHFFIF